jgi:predicted ATP-grasp superfamily ATP-dependent carboligase
VLGGQVTGLGAVRCLGRAGIPVVLLAPRGDYAGRSRWAGRVEHGLAETNDGAALAAFLERLGLEQAVVLPCSDRWVRAAATLPPESRERFRAPVADADTIETLVDKAGLAELLERHGVPHPRTIEVGGSVPDGHEVDGWFVKPRDSQAFVQRFGVKGFRLAGRADADAHLAAAAEAGLAVLLQEYVPGPPDAHYFVDGYVALDGRPLAFFARRRLRMYPPDFGNSTYHVSVPLEEVSDAVEHLRRLLSGSAYVGIFSAEFKRDARDGVLKLLEVNVRPWWYVEFAALCGVDVCSLAYRDALGLPVEAPAPYRVGHTCVLPGADVRAFRATRRESALGLVPWLRSWSGASHTVWRLDDPLPGPFQLASVALRPLRRRF